MTYKTKEELERAIAETIQQENLFRIAGDPLNCAFWILERVKLRAQLYGLLLRADHANPNV